MLLSAEWAAAALQVADSMLQQQVQESCCLLPAFLRCLAGAPAMPEPLPAAPGLSQLLLRLQLPARLPPLAAQTRSWACPPAETR